MAAVTPQLSDDRLRVGLGLLVGVAEGLARVELLKQVDPFDHSRNVVLLDRSKDRLYLAETGLVPPAGGAGLPNHHTAMRLLPGDRSLREGQNEVKVQFESEAVGGVRLV